LKKLVFGLFLGAISFAACGDHVTIPADKTGDCVKGLLQKCGGDCVDTQTSLTNCGACGNACNVMKGEICNAGKCTGVCPTGSTRCNDRCVDTAVDRSNCGMCGKGCGINELCAKGMCAASCEAAGYLTCNGVVSMIDAGGAINCVDSKNDSNNCGKCGNVCAGMTSCSGGVCCPAGQTGCNGVCVNLQADGNNCGACGNVCPMAAQNCLLGGCTKCKADVLVLGDAQTGVNQSMSAAMKAVGFRPTVVNQGSSQYTGMPAAADFAAIVLTPANDYPLDMPMAGQQAINSAWQGGAGIVLDGFFLFAIAQYPQHWATLKALALMAYANTNTYTTFVVNTNGVQTNVFFGSVGSGFSQVYLTQFFAPSVINNGIVVGTLSNNWAAEAYRAMPNGKIVQFNHALNYGGESSEWIGDPNMAQWTFNGIKYVAGCTP